MRLGAYDESGLICDYTNKNCSHYQEFGIEDKIPHISDGIALVRLDRPLHFGPKMKPICLPFRNNNIHEPGVFNSLIYTGWKAKESHDYCLHDGRHFCYMLIIDYDGYAVMHEFEQQRMVLEGIAITPLFRGHFTYIRVRDYENWLDQNMKM